MGKSTFAKFLHDKFDCYIVKSFTTRPQRDKEDTDHIFIPRSVGQRIFEWDPCVARTIINGEFYFTIEENFHPSKTNVYVIDGKGIDQLCEDYPDWDITVVKIVSDEVNVSANRKNRKISVPTDDECDMIIKRDGKDYDVFYRQWKDYVREI